MSDPADPIPEIEATPDGVFVQSRRIGNTVYVVSRYAPWVEGLHYYVSTPEQQAENDALLASATLDDLLPKITIGGVRRELVGDHPGLHVVTVGQAEVFLGRDVAEHGGAVPSYNFV